MSDFTKDLPRLSVIAGSLVGLVGGLVALVAVGGSSTAGVALGLVIGLAFLVMALGVVLGLMLHAQRRPG